MISFCIHSQRLSLKRKGLTDARVESFTKKECGFPHIKTRKNFSFLPLINNFVSIC